MPGSGKLARQRASKAPTNPSASAAPTPTNSSGGSASSSPSPQKMPSRSNRRSWQKDSQHARAELAKAQAANASTISLKSRLDTCLAETSALLGLLSYSLTKLKRLQRDLDRVLAGSPTPWSGLAWFRTQAGRGRPARSRGTAPPVFARGCRARSFSSIRGLLSSHPPCGCMIVSTRFPDRVSWSEEVNTWIQRARTAITKTAA